MNRMNKAGIGRLKQALITIEDMQETALQVGLPIPAYIYKKLSSKHTSRASY